MVGATMGAMPMTSMSRESSVAAAEPVNRSRTVAMATTETAALPRPWTTRAAVSSSTVGADAANSDATMCRARPAMRGLRRPMASASGPTSSCPSPRPRRIPVRVPCTWASVAASSSAMDGIAGRYVSIVSGPMAMRAPRTRTNLA